MSLSHTVEPVPTPFTAITAPLAAFRRSPLTMLTLCVALLASGALPFAGAFAGSLTGWWTSDRDVGAPLLVGVVSVAVWAVLLVMTSVVVRAAARRQSATLRVAWKLAKPILGIFVLYLIIVAVATVALYVAGTAILAVIVSLAGGAPAVAVAAVATVWLLELTVSLAGALICAAALAGAGNPFAIGRTIGWINGLAAIALQLVCLWVPVALTTFSFFSGQNPMNDPVVRVSDDLVRTDPLGQLAFLVIVIFAILVPVAVLVNALSMAGLSAMVSPELAGPTNLAPKRGKVLVDVFASQGPVKALEEEAGASWMANTIPAAAPPVDGQVTGVMEELAQPTPPARTRTRSWGVQDN